MNNWFQHLISFYHPTELGFHIKRPFLCVCGFSRFYFLVPLYSASRRGLKSARRWSVTRVLVLTLLSISCLALEESVSLNCCFLNLGNEEPRATSF